MADASLIYILESEGKYIEGLALGGNNTQHAPNIFLEFHDCSMLMVHMNCECIATLLFFSRVNT